MEQALLLVEQQDHILTVQLNNPPANTLSAAVCEALCGVFHTLPDTVDVVILTGNAAFFSAGADIKTFSLTEPARNDVYFTQIYAVMETVFTCPVPVVAAVNGVAMGAGMELALCCDIRIGDAGLRMGATSANMGLVFCTQRLPRLIGQARAAELIYTARILNGEEALTYGLIAEVAPAGGALDVAQEKARLIASKPGSCLRRLKTVLRAGEGQLLNTALEREREQLFGAFRDEAFPVQIQKFLHRKDQ